MQDNQRQADDFTDRDAAYLFAGEGSINIAIPVMKNTGKIQPSLRASVATTEKLWANLLYNRYGGFTWVQKPTNTKHRYVFGWRVTGKEAEAFLRAIQPFLKGEKVVQLGLMLKFREDARSYYREGIGRGIRSQEELWKWYHQEMKRVRLAAAETNRRDAENALQSDSPTPAVMPD